MKVKQLIFMIIGCVCLGLGCIGIALPILPTVPFFMATLFFFANSSKRLHDWFVGTKLYKNHLQSFTKGEGMTWSTKIRIMFIVTLLMGFGFFMMIRKEIWVPCIILACVWIAHIVAFTFIIKTKKAE